MKNNNFFLKYYLPIGNNNTQVLKLDLIIQLIESFWLDIYKYNKSYSLQAQAGVEINNTHIPLSNMYTTNYHNKEIFIDLISNYYEINHEIYNNIVFNRLYLKYRFIKYVDDISLIPVHEIFNYSSNYTQYSNLMSYSNKIKI